jgi:chaperonin GroEL
LHQQDHQDGEQAGDDRKVEDPADVQLQPYEKCDGDERTGLRILKRALESPTRQIAENSALDGGVVVGQMRTGTGNSGLDASTRKYVDLVETGIIDPTKVVRLALENAVSVASFLLLTEVTLTELPEPKSEASHRAGYPEE